MRQWWRRLHGDDALLDDKHLRETAGTFVRRYPPFGAQVILNGDEWVERKTHRSTSTGIGGIGDLTSRAMALWRLCVLAQGWVYMGVFMISRIPASKVSSRRRWP